ncbi:MAG: hypothetical protein ACYC4H_10015 [Desulfocucumaceae bacterium]
MEQLTQMELLQIEEMLRAEDLAIKKCKFYAGSCHDADLKKVFMAGADAHQMHLEGLMGQLRALNGKAH